MAILEKWEYKYISEKEIDFEFEGSLTEIFKIDKFLSAFEKKLNEMGSEGWEFMPPQYEGGVFGSYKNFPSSRHYFFRRRVSP